MFRSVKDWQNSVRFEEEIADARSDWPQTHDTSVRHAVGKADAHFDWTNTRETSITRVAKLPSRTRAKHWPESRETSDSDGCRVYVPPGNDVRKRSTTRKRPFVEMKERTHSPIRQRHGNFRPCPFDIFY